METPFIARQAGGHQRRDRRRRAGQHLHRKTGGHTAPHEQIAGIGHERHSGVGDECHHRAVAHPPHQLSGTGLLVVLVIGEELGLDAVAVEQDPGPAVSSQATTSASRSAASTRSVTSSRLPIGVGQTTSRPVMSPPPVPEPATRPRSSPPRLRNARAGSTQRREVERRSLSHHHPGGLQQEVACAYRATSDDDHLRIEDVDHNEPVAGRRPDVLERGARNRIAAVGQLGDDSPLTSTPPARRRPSSNPAARAPAARPRGRSPAPRRGSRSSPARGRRPDSPPRQLEHGMAQFAAHAGRTR